MNSLSLEERMVRDSLMTISRLMKFFSNEDAAEQNCSVSKGTEESHKSIREPPEMFEPDVRKSLSLARRMPN